MITLKVKPFKSVIFENEQEKEIKVEEGQFVKFVTEIGEVQEGFITKLETKKITIKSNDEIFEKSFQYDQISQIEVVQERQND